MNAPLGLLKSNPAPSSVIVIPADPVCCVLHGGVTQTLLRTTIWLDEYATSILIKGLFVGSGVAWVAAEVTAWTGVGALAGGAVAAILALGGALIQLCDLRGQGIVLLSGIIPPRGACHDEGSPTLGRSRSCICDHHRWYCFHGLGIQCDLARHSCLHDCGHWNDLEEDAAKRMN